MGGCHSADAYRQVLMRILPVIIAVVACTMLMSAWAEMRAKVCVCLSSSSFQIAADEYVHRCAGLHHSRPSAGRGVT